MAKNTKMTELSVEFIARRHHLMAFIEWLVRDPDVAEDIFQQVWVRLAEAVETGTEIRDLDKWCRTVARNTFLQGKRKKSAKHELVDSRLIDLAQEAFAEQDDAQDDWLNRGRALKECVRSLTDRHQQLLELRYDQGLPVSKIASITSRTASAVMMALSRIRGILRSCIKRRVGLAGER